MGVGFFILLRGSTGLIGRFSVESWIFIFWFDFNFNRFDIDVVWSGAGFVLCGFCFDVGFD